MNERWHQIERLYHAALERDPRTRAEFLDRECSSDASLREEVESLLSATSRARGFPERTDLNETATLPENRIGPYQILSPLGAGGMGEVYRAHDSKLGRDVAIKTLPRTFAMDAGRVARFRREARILASLNHPNIAAIYGLEETSGINFLILELVEGNTLKEILERSGPMPTPQALRVGCQVAEALEAAHSKGIIHRDLKPANVKVTPEGRVKVLDFGLAKAIAFDEAKDPAGRTLPSSNLATMAGSILGTPSYMSPEQARGGAADKRSDVWSFGCLLYELLSGQQAFHGPAVSDTLAAVLEREPDWHSVPAAIPDKLRALLKNCLRKDPSLRLPDGGAIRKHLEEANAATRTGLRPWHVAAAAAVVGLAIFGAMRWSSRATPHIASPSEWIQITNFPDAVSQPALSPDGKMLTFIRGGTTFAGPGEIYIKALPSGEAVQLTHDGMAKMHPVFSPDGSRIAYTVLGARQSWDTWVIPVFGGSAKPWLANASGLTWNGTGRLLFSEIKSGQHMAIVESAEDGTASHDVYVPPTEGGMAHRSYPSPDGKSVLIVEMDDQDIWVPCRIVPAQGGSIGHAIGPHTGGCVNGAWSKDGKWVYLSVLTGENYHLWRQRVADGKPEQLTFGTSGEEGIAVATDGRSLITAVGAQQREVMFHGPTGDRRISTEGYAYSPKISADGNRVFFRVARTTGLSIPYRGSSELWMADLESERNERVLPELIVNGYDVAADGRLAVTANDAAGKSHVWLASADSRIPPRMVPNTDGALSPFFALPGELVYFTDPRSAYLIREDGRNRRAVAAQVDEIHRVSPDARWMIAIVRSPRGVVSAAISLDAESPAVPIGPFWPEFWSRDGKYFFIAVSDAAGTAGAYGRIYSIPLPRGKMLPDIPPGGFRYEREIAALPGASLIVKATPDFSPGPTLDTYAYSRISSQRNLYRIPLVGN